MKKTFAFVLAIILLCSAALADVQNQLNTRGLFRRNTLPIADARRSRWTRLSMCRR